MMVRMIGAVLGPTRAQTRLQLGHVWPLGHLGVHVLLPLPLLLLPPLLIRLVTFFFLKNTAVTCRVLLLRLGQGSLVAAATDPAHQLGAVVLQWAESYNQHPQTNLR